MRIKVFKAADLKEAMAMVKDELGRDAVILHTKRYKQGGFLGYKSKEVVEVTAAVDDTPRRPRVKLPAMPRTPRQPAARPPRRFPGSGAESGDRTSCDAGNGRIRASHARADFACSGSAENFKTGKKTSAAD